jgi:ethanolamine ammonia-lyase large subunit
VVSGHVKTQLIAHDKEVYDIAFSRAGGGRDMFASVGKLCSNLDKSLYN